MSRKELSRVEVMGAGEGGRLAASGSGGVAGTELPADEAGLGAVSAGRRKGLQHGHCERRSNRAYAAEFRAPVLEQAKARYQDFGPTLDGATTRASVLAKGRASGE